MLRDRNGIKKITGVGIMATFGLLTMSSNLLEGTSTAIIPKVGCYYEPSGVVFSDESVCMSSRLSKQALGDFVSTVIIEDFMNNHEKIRVDLRITKINKHVPFFDFDDEYEAI